MGKMPDCPLFIEQTGLFYSFIQQFHEYGAENSCHERVVDKHNNKNDLIGCKLERPNAETHDNRADQACDDRAYHKRRYLLPIHDHRLPDKTSPQQKSHIRKEEIRDEAEHAHRR